ncbi:hypothetical protein [Halopelagius fulvigenes]|uniref:Uncharacterized protein n=1 Tax=Halopelagius fulvigenes TaxID=1198324 RepID=A0ABD5TVB4_9EURY
MSYNRRSEFGLPSRWLELNSSAIELLFAVTVVLGSMSLFALASGDPETTAFIALTGIAVVLLGTALVRLSEHLRTNRTPLS